MTNYRIWHGLSGGDEDGFENAASVSKVFGDHPDLPTLLSSLNMPVPKNGPPNTPAATLRRPRTDSNDSGSSLLSAFKKARVDSQTPAASGTTSTNTSRTVRQTVSVSDSYLRANTTLRFHSHHHSSRTIRARPLSQCASSVRLFDQMKAGRVFAPTSDSRVVYAEIEGVEENMALVEGDEEDFEGLLVWIRRNGGFEVGGDGLERGVCVVDVSAGGL